MARETVQQSISPLRRITAVTICAGTLACASPGWASDRGWDHASSIGRDVLVAVAIGVPLVTGDGPGVLQAGGSLGASELAVLGLKEAFPELRPDRSDRKSFPSGHTAVSFASAATLQNRYGWKVGLPAQLAAGFVGVARVKADKHHWYDVAAGAVIGEISGFLITSPKDEQVKVFPWADSKGGGVALVASF